MNSIRLQQVLPAVFAETPPARSDVWLRDVAFDRGKTHLVEAASGTGKSSLCGYLYGYRRDYSGTILFDGDDARRLGVQRWSTLRRRSLSITFQGLRLFPELSALENVRLKNNLTAYKTEAGIRRMFEALGVAEKLHAPVAKLSFGQQQRVAFIRMLCQPADFMLLDEPVSHLDDANSAAMADLLVEEQRSTGAGVIVTSIGRSIALTYDNTFAL